MLRALVAVIAGYLSLFLVVFGGLTVAFLSMGTAAAFEPGSYDVSKAWILVSVVVTAAAALVGGLVCGKIAQTRTPVKVLMALVGVLGLLSASVVMYKPAPTEPRPESLSNFEAMQSARTPAWAGALNTLIGVVGVAAGAGRRAPRNIV